MTTTPALSIEQLARFMNKPVQYEMRTVNRDWHTETSPLSLSMLLVPTMYRNIRPVLRRLSSLSEEEARECFRVAFGMKECPPIKACVCFGPKWMIISDEPKNLLGSKCLWFGSLCSGKYINNQDMTCSIDAIALIRYLESISIDVDSLLESGQAMEGK